MPMSDNHFRQVAYMARNYRRYDHQHPLTPRSVRDVLAPKDLAHCRSRPRWSRSLKLDPASLHVRFLLDRDHLPFHLSKFAALLLIPADEECGRPEDDDGASGCNAVVGALAVLDAR